MVRFTAGNLRVNGGGTWEGGERRRSVLDLRATRRRPAQALPHGHRLEEEVDEGADLEWDVPAADVYEIQDALREWVVPEDRDQLVPEEGVGPRRKCAAARRGRSRRPPHAPRRPSSGSAPRFAPARRPSRSGPCSTQESCDPTAMQSCCARSFSRRQRGVR